MKHRNIDQQYRGNNRTDAIDARPADDARRRLSGGEVLPPVKRKLLGVGFGVFLLVLWQILSMMIRQSFLLPGPFSVLESIGENARELFLVHLPATLEVMGIGLGISLLVGSLLAVWMDQHPAAQKAIYPILTFTQTIPVMCLAPVLVLWFGYSVLMRVIVVVLVTFFTVTVHLFDGFRSVRADRTELLQSFGADRWQQYKLLRIPTVLTHLLTALHIALPWSAIAAVIAEWLGASRGMGVFSKAAMMSLDAAGLLAPFAILSVVVLLLNMFLVMADKWCARHALT